MERHRAAQIWKEQHEDAQNSMGGPERCQVSHSWTDQSRASQSINRHHGEAQIRMDRDRQQSGTEQHRSGRSNMKMHRTARVDRSGARYRIVGRIRAERHRSSTGIMERHRSGWSGTGGKERHRSWRSGYRRHRSGWGGVGWQWKST